MKRPLAILLIVIVAALVTGATVFFWNRSTTSPTTYSLRQEWIPWMGYTGEVVAQSKGFFGPRFNLTIKPGGLEADPIKLVASGVDQFGVAGAERVLTAIAEGIPLVIIGTVNHTSPTVFLTLERSGITKPQQFVSKRVGVLSGSNTEVVYRALLEATGIKKDSLTEVEIGFDLPAFIRGSFDVLPAFAYDEPITLRKEGVVINVITPSDYGVHAMGNVYFTTRQMVEQQPEVVQAFVTGALRGWTYAFANPDESIAMLAGVDSKLDLEKEKQSLLAARPYFESPGKPLLEVRREDFEREVSMLRGIGQLSRTVNVETSVAPQFIERAR